MYAILLFKKLFHIGFKMKFNINYLKIFIYNLKFATTFQT